MRSSWGEQARAAILQILEDNKGKSAIHIKKALQAGYPWPPRRLHPYKVWLKELHKLCPTVYPRKHQPKVPLFDGPRRTTAFTAEIDRQTSQR